MYKRVILGPIENVKDKAYFLPILWSFWPVYSVNSVTFLPSFLWNSTIFIYFLLEYIQPAVVSLILICLPVLPHFLLFFKRHGLPSSAMTTVSLPPSVYHSLKLPLKECASKKLIFKIFDTMAFTDIWEAWHLSLRVTSQHPVRSGWTAHQHAWL